jgi:hypothetical protein
MTLLAVEMPQSMQGWLVGPLWGAHAAHGYFCMATIIFYILNYGIL